MTALGTCAICGAAVVQYEGTVGLVCLKDSRHDIDAGPDDERGRSMSATTIPKPVDRSEWLKVRHPYFNASQAGALYGVHPFQSLADVAVEKLQAEPDDTEANEAMDRGVRLEPALLDWAADSLGTLVEVPNVLYVRDHLMSTIDGIPVGMDDVWVEAKTSSHRHDEPADYWRSQIAAQAASTGRRECMCVWIDSDLRFKHAWVKPSDEEIEDVLARSKQFMDFIALGMFPEGVELTAEHLSKIFPQHNAGEFVDLDDDGYDALVAWEYARQVRLAAEKKEEAAKDAAARLIAGAEGATYGGKLVATWKANKSSIKTDWNALAERYPRAVAKFDRMVPGARVLRATKALLEEDAAA